MFTLEMYSSIFLKVKLACLLYLRNLEFCLKRVLTIQWKSLRTYNRGNFTSLEFENYYKEVEIKRHKTTIYTLQQNVVVECMNVNLLQWVRIMFSNANLEQELWEKSSSYNMSPSKLTIISCNRLYDSSGGMYKSFLWLFNFFF